MGYAHMPTRGTRRTDPLLWAYSGTPTGRCKSVTGNTSFVARSAQGLRLPPPAVSCFHAIEGRVSRIRSNVPSWTLIKHPKKEVISSCVNDDIRRPFGLRGSARSAGRQVGARTKYINVCGSTIHYQVLLCTRYLSEGQTRCLRCGQKVKGGERPSFIIV